MTDTVGATPPFPGFPGFPPAEMLDRMWGMMRLTPFGSAFPGAEPGAAQGLGPSLSMMSDLMAPLTNVEELDKRITDMRAVEQWLKLNLSMLQSAIQALEVQRATLVTLRAFGTFAQAQMTPPPAEEPPARRASPLPEAHSAADPGAAGQRAGAPSPGGEAPPFDASAWWNLLQSQFNQLAQFAMAQPAAAATQDDGAPPKPDAKPPGAGKRATTRSAPRATKKTPPKPE
ncbi:MAG TPA: PhaM family polyhydroxyalkanoate granule multifunctional regulatory protein [Paraburkholderia sp.]